MTFEEFLIRVKSAVDKNLADGTSLQYKSILKNNEVAVTGAYFSRGPEEAGSRLIYMEPLYGLMKGTDDIDAAAELLLREKESPVPERYRRIRADCFEEIRGQLILRLVGKERNKNRLPGLVYREFLDMAACVCILFQSEEEERGLTEVSRKMADSWGIPDEELLDTALKNTEILLPDTLRTLREAAALPEGEDGVDDCYVLSNEACYLGAAAVLYTGKIAGIAEKYDSDLYLIPSSIHEMILVPANSMDENFLREAIRSVNENEVPPEDILTESLYLYRRENGRIDRVPD